MLHPDRRTWLLLLRGSLLQRWPQMILLSSQPSVILLETQKLVAKADTGRMRWNSFKLILWSYHRLCYSYLPPLNLPSQLQEVIHGIKMFHQPQALVICSRSERCKLQSFLFLHCWTNIYQIPAMSTNFSPPTSSKHPKGLNSHECDWYPASPVKRLWLTLTNAV